MNRLERKINDKFLSKATLLCEEGKPDKWIIFKQDWNEVINYNSEKTRLKTVKKKQQNLKRTK